MDRPNRNRILKIGAALILISIVLFSFSVYLIDSNEVSNHNITIPAGSSFTLAKGPINAGDDIDYSVTTNLDPFNASIYLSYDTGPSVAYANVTNSSSVTNVIVSPYTANVSLVIVNTGSSSISLSASVGTVGYVTLVTLVFGFVLLPSGIALVGIYYYSRHKERVKEKLRGL